MLQPFKHGFGQRQSLLQRVSVAAGKLRNGSSAFSNAVAFASYAAFYVCLVFFAGILVLLSLRDDTRQALVVTPIWLVRLAVTYQFVRNKRQVSGITSSR